VQLGRGSIILLERHLSIRHGIIAIIIIIRATGSVDLPLPACANGALNGGQGVGGRLGLLARVVWVARGKRGRGRGKMR
jgi:hypothetical protein